MCSLKGLKILLSMHINCKTTNKIGFNVTNITFGVTPLNQGNNVIHFIILHKKLYF